MDNHREHYETELYTIAVTGGATPDIIFYFKYDNGLIGSNVKIRLSDVDQFTIDLKRLKDAAEKRLDGNVKFITA